MHFFTNDSSTELGSRQLVSRLLSDINSPEGLPLDFIQELAAKVDEEQFDQVREIISLKYSNL